MSTRSLAERGRTKSSSPLRLAGLLAVAIVVGGAAWKSAFSPVDFPVYHDVGTDILSGHFELYQQGVYDVGSPVDEHRFRYAPVVAVLLTPFALLPLPIAALVFAALKIAAFWNIVSTIVHRLYERAASIDVLPDIALVTFLVVGGYAVEELRTGNFHLFSVWLMVVAFDRAERGQVAAPAFAAALAVAAKLTPLALVGYLALIGRRSAAIASLLALVCLALVPALVWGWNQNTHLLQGFARFATLKAADPGNYSLLGLLSGSDIAGAGWIVIAVWLLVALTAAGAAMWTIRKHTRAPAIREVGFGLLVTGLVLFSPHTQRIHFVSLCAPVALLVAWLRQRQPDPNAALIKAALAVTFAFGTLIPAVLSSRQWSLLYLKLNPYFFAAAWLFVVLLVVGARSSADGTRVKCPGVTCRGIRRGGL